MLLRYLSIALSGFLISAIFIGILKKLSLAYKLLIAKGIPLVGGVGLGLCFILISFLGAFPYQNPPKEIIGIVVSSGLMLAFGVIDDWRELSVRLKFLVQIIATTILIFFGIKTQIIYIGNIANMIITFIWVLGITNAFNHLDIMDGVASLTAIIVSLAFFVISILNGDIRMAFLSFTLASVTLGFFLYNFPPAKIYLGNSGSHFLGFVLAAIALTISYAPLKRKIALLSPLFILGLPIFDTAFLILMRIFKKNLPFKKSNDHLALRFLAIGYTKKKALLILIFMCLFFCLCGIALTRTTNILGTGVVVFVFLISLLIAIKMSKVEVNG